MFRQPACMVATAHKQRGIVALEFALMFVFGLLPLLLFTFAGVLTFSAQQALTLAAADGARAALRYPISASSSQTPLDARVAHARTVAADRMDWLIAAAGNQPGAVAATPAPCPAYPSITCMTVTTRSMCQQSSTAFCWWMLVDDLGSQATVQLPASVPLPASP